MSSIKKNFLYSVFYQILAIIIPIITIPYSSRVLGVTGIGTYSFTYSISYYFMIIAMLGINNYGSREIAKKNSDFEKTSETFWSIYFFQLLFSTSIFLIYIMYVFIYVKEYKEIFYIQGLHVLSSVFDINWFYIGIEKFKITVTRNSIIKIITLVCILVFVKSKNDLFIYTLILSGSVFISNVILLLFLKGNVKFKKIRFIEIIKHFKACLILFIPVIAMKVYKVIDKTMLGVFVNVDEVGYYSNADSIINVPMGIIIALGTVMLPRITSLNSNKKNESAQKLFQDSMKFSLFLMIPISIGMFFISKDFSILFFGEKFTKTGEILRILSITIIFMTIANGIRTQYLIPKNKDKEYIIAVIIGAIVSLIFNLIFIRKYKSIGSAFGTVITEFIVMCLHIYYYNKDENFNIIINKCKKIFISILVMIIYLYIIDILIIRNIYLKLTLQITGAFLIYIIININYILNNILKKNK